MEVPRLYIDQNHFPKSPLGSPSKILKALDLLVVKGKFSPQSEDVSRGSSPGNSPAISKYIKMCSDKKCERRSSFTSDVIYDHTISDEFAHIVLTIKERRRNSFGNEQYSTKKANSSIKISENDTYLKNIGTRIILAKVCIT